MTRQELYLKAALALAPAVIQEERSMLQGDEREVSNVPYMKAAEAAANLTAALDYHWRDYGYEADYGPLFPTDPALEKTLSRK